MSEHNVNLGSAQGGSDTRSMPRDGAVAGVDMAGGALAVAKADLGKRFVAALIDGVISGVIGLIPLIGGLIAAAYWLVRDGLEFEFMDRRSIGKKIMKLRPVRLDGSPMDIETSAQRNWMFALGGITSLLLFIPIIGWLLMIPVALVLVAIVLFEIFKVLSDEEGRRIGDSLARTKIIEVES